jgi:hypothetical protein
MVRRAIFLVRWDFADGLLNTEHQLQFIALQCKILHKLIKLSTPTLGLKNNKTLCNPHTT